MFFFWLGGFFGVLLCGFCFCPLDFVVFFWLVFGCFICFLVDGFGCLVGLWFWVFLVGLVLSLVGFCWLVCCFGGVCVLGLRWVWGVRCGWVVLVFFWFWGGVLRWFEGFVFFCFCFWVFFVFVLGVGLCFVLGVVVEWVGLLLFFFFLWGLGGVLVWCDWFVSLFSAFCFACWGVWYGLVLVLCFLWCVGLCLVWCFVLVLVVVVLFVVVLGWLFLGFGGFGLG